MGRKGNEKVRGRSRERRRIGREAKKRRGRLPGGGGILEGARGRGR